MGKGRLFRKRRRDLAQSPELAAWRSTLITSAPKSDKMTAALDRDEAREVTTFKPEKIFSALFSVAMVCVPPSFVCY